MDKILKTLKSFPKYELNSAINNGGCALFAFHLRRAIIKAGGECTVHICYPLDDYDNGLEDVNRCISKYSSNGNLDEALINGKTRNVIYGCMYHVCVKYKGELYDSDGEVSDNYCTVSDNISDIALLYAIRNRHAWNGCFRRALGKYAGGYIIHNINKIFARNFPQFQ